MPELTDVNSDQQQHGLETDLTIDRATAARLGITVSQIDNTLYDAFGQRQVSTIYNALNQYHVVMEVEPRYWQDPTTLSDIYVSTAGAVSSVQSTNALAGTTASPSGSAASGAEPQPGRGAQSADQFADDHGTHQRLDRRVGEHQRREDGPARCVQHLRPGHHAAVGQSPGAVRRVDNFVQPRARRVAERCDRCDQRCDVAARRADNDPRHFRARRRSSSSRCQNEPMLVLAALLAVYIVLGVLYESYVHPITILSTLPSAGVGAVLALLHLQHANSTSSR